jgi:hypothetical protein
LRGLCCAIFWILGHYGSILGASLWSPIFNIRVVAAETRFDFARNPVRVGIMPNYISRKSRSHMRLASGLGREFCRGHFFRWWQYCLVEVGAKPWLRLREKIG